MTILLFTYLQPIFFSKLSVLRHVNIITPYFMLIYRHLGTTVYNLYGILFVSFWVIVVITFLSYLEVSTF